MPKHNYNIWWGPPKKFSTLIAERKVSWLELFYDLVYVIVISKITHYLPQHPDMKGLLDYGYLFAMVFWGWFNGSYYHDLHGSPGIRTRLMTLWQMVAVGALAVTLEDLSEDLVYRVTFALLFLQIYITYLWWSVGIYDKHHRKLNVPYTVSFLLAFVLLILTLFIPFPYKRLVFWIALLLNYLPFVLTALRFKRTGASLSLSPSMTERLGLLTIIVFGEAILGVINSISNIEMRSTTVWVCFVFGILIVFGLWWIFFSTVADRACKNGMFAGNAVALSYIPTLASLGMVGASFPSLLKNIIAEETCYSNPLQILFGVSIASFLFFVTVISRYLVFPVEYEVSRKRMQLLLIAAGCLNLLLMFVFPFVPLYLYLFFVLCSLLIVIVEMTRIWFKIELIHIAEQNNKKSP